MNISGLFVTIVSNIIRQYPALFPYAGEEVDHTGDGIAVGGETVAQHEAIESPAQCNTEEPADSRSANRFDFCPQRNPEIAETFVVVP